MNSGSLQSDGKAASGLESCLPQLYEKSRGREIRLEKSEFAAILQEITAKYLPPDAPEHEVETFCGSLRVEELALAASE